MTTENTLDYSEFTNPILARAVVEQMGGEESFLEKWQDVSNYGIAGGFNGFTFYAETCEFAKSNMKLIVDLAKQQADDFGTGLLEMIASFNYLHNDYSLDEIAETIWGGAEDTQILNALAWYAAEEICREFECIQDNK